MYMVRTAIFLEDVRLLPRFAVTGVCSLGGAGAFFGSFLGSLRVAGGSSDFAFLTLAVPS